MRTLSKVEVRPARNGKGLFAARSYKPHERIIKITGKIVAADTVYVRGGKFADNCFRFGPETYLDPGQGAGRYLNHSCQPNAGIRKSNNQLFVFAIERIRVDEEIGIDYSTTLGDDDVWTMRCKCGYEMCRRTIKRFGSLPSLVRERYTQTGMVPGYILNTL